MPGSALAFIVLVKFYGDGVVSEARHVIIVYFLVKSTRLVGMRLFPFHQAHVPLLLLPAPGLVFLRHGFFERKPVILPFKDVVQEVFHVRFSELDIERPM